MADKPGFPDVLALGPTGYGDELLWGAAMSVSIALLAYALGLLIGIIGAMAKLQGSALTRSIMAGYTTLVRAVPELILILILYYAGTATLNRLLESSGFTAIAINGFAAAVLVLGFVQGAYSTEVLRAAIQAIPIGQMEAAKAYGMSPWLTFRRITLPSMLPYAIPGLANLWLIVIKDTALIAVVGGSPELAQVSQSAAAFTKRYNLFLLTAGAMYLAMSLVSTYFIGKVEAHFRRGQQKLA